MENKQIPELNSASVSRFSGNHPDGEVSCITLCNKNGMRASVLSYGAVLQSLKTTTVSGEEVDVVLGFDSIENYIASYQLPAPPYFGAIVGRHAGRIRNATLPIKGKTYQLDANNNTHSLHGGKLGLARKLWSVVDLTHGEHPSVSLQCVSPHMEDGFPGELTVVVTYTLTDRDELFVDMSATTNEDTVVNLTQHSYFNMDGHSGAVNSQSLFVNSMQMTETTPDLIPTGKFVPLQGSPFDFRKPRHCPKKIDSTFTLDKTSNPAAWLHSEKTGLRLTVYTDQPALHIYVGGDLFGRLTGKNETAYHPLSGICFETQKYPNAPNQPTFPSTILKKEDTYRHRTIYQLQTISI